MAFEQELRAAQAAADAAVGTAHRLRVRQALTAAGMPAARATDDLAAALVSAPAGCDDRTLTAAVEGARRGSPGLFDAAPTSGSALPPAAEDGNTGRRALEEFGYKTGDHARAQLERIGRRDPRNRSS